MSTHYNIKMFNRDHASKYGLELIRDKESGFFRFVASIDISHYNHNKHMQAHGGHVFVSSFSSLTKEQWINKLSEFVLRNGLRNNKENY